MPLVSIILPTFDREVYLRDTVRSVFAQSLTDWELLIADDGSNEPTRAYLRELQPDARVRILWLAHAGNPAAVRNAALRAARGEYVAFLDSDDLWEPDKLARQLELLRKQPTCQWSYCAFVRVDERGAVLAEEATRHWEPWSGAIFAAILRGQASLRTPCVLATRALVADAGGFDESLQDCEDLDLWLRLALRSDVALVDEPLVRVRIADCSYTTRRRHARVDQIRVIEKLLVLDVPHWRRLLRAEHARHTTLLAREYAATGNRALMMRTLAANLPHAWAYPYTWYGALRALMTALSVRAS